MTLSTQCRDARGPTTRGGGLESAVHLLVVLFPVLSVAMAHAGSLCFIAIALPAILLTSRDWSARARDQRLWLLLYPALLLVAAGSLIYTADTDEGIARLGGYLRLAAIGPVFLLLRRVRWRGGPALLFSVGIAGGIMAMQAAYQTLALGAVAAEGYCHKIVFGDTAVLYFAVLIAAMPTVLRRARHGAALFIASGSCVYASLMSATRGSWLVMAIVCAALPLLQLRHSSRRAAVRSAIPLLLLIAAGLLARPDAVTRGIQSGLRDLSQFRTDPAAGNSWGSRLNMWRNSLIIWTQHPVLGTGVGDFHHDSAELVATGVSHSDVLKYSHAHSIYFHALATLGMLGLALTVAATILFPARHFLRAWTRAETPWVQFHALAGLLVVLAFAGFGLTEEWISRNPFVNAYVIFLALCAAGCDSARR